MSMKIVCVDFDGVIHSYSSGWEGACIISDPPVHGAFEWLSEMVSDGRFEVCIYSSRSKEDGAIEAMQDWFKKWGLAASVLEMLKFPTQKPAATMTIDDRAFCFKGSFPPPAFIVEFKPWNKK